MPNYPIPYTGGLIGGLVERSRIRRDLVALETEAVRLRAQVQAIGSVRQEMVREVGRVGQTALAEVKALGDICGSYTRIDPPSGNGLRLIAEITTLGIGEIVANTAADFARRLP